jgi:hypothetical protein
MWFEVLLDVVASKRGAETKLPLSWGRNDSVESLKVRR